MSSFHFNFRLCSEALSFWSSGLADAFPGALRNPSRSAKKSSLRNCASNQRRDTGIPASIRLRFVVGDKTLAAVARCLVCLSWWLIGCTSEPTDSPKDTPASAPPQALEQSTNYVSQATAHYQAGRFDTVLALCRAGLELDSTAVALYNFQAAVYSAQGRYALAIEALEKAVHFHPDYATGYVNLGGIYTTLGRYTEAEENLRQALALEPDHSAVHRRLGEIYLGTSRYGDAIRQLEQALYVYPQDATLYFFLSQALEGDGQEEAALEAMATSTRLDIGFTEAYYRVAGLARKLGRYSQAQSALKRFQHLQQIGDGDPDVPKQMKKLRDSILNAPENPFYHYKLGVFFSRQGYIDEALNKFDKAIRLDPGNLILLNQIASILIKEQRLEEALRYCEKALAHQPDFFPALINAGSILSMSQRREEALNFFHQAVSASPQDSRGWYYLGRELLRKPGA